MTLPESDAASASTTTTPSTGADHTVLRAIYPQSRGKLRLRGGSAGLAWLEDKAPDHVDGDVSTFHLSVPDFGPVQVKLVRDDGAWMVGRNAVIGRGDVITLRPAFDRRTGDLSANRMLTLPDGSGLCFRVRLPPSYSEQEGLRYPVLYTVLDELWDVGALDEIIVVSIDTGLERLDKLGPVPDPHHGGGRGGDHLAAIVSELKPLIDVEYPTLASRQNTVLLGSSMGGLFSLWAAWTRPDIFGGAICLSPSLWWGERFMLGLVSGGTCPAPRPNLYLDSGAAASGFEEDASTRDGVHNTRAMYRALREHCYAMGDDLYLLSWTGHHHDSRSWATRVSTPLQLFFPRST